MTGLITRIKSDVLYRFLIRSFQMKTTSRKLKLIIPPLDFTAKCFGVLDLFIYLNDFKIHEIKCKNLKNWQINKQFHCTMARVFFLLCVFDVVFKWGNVLQLNGSNFTTHTPCRCLKIWFHWIHILHFSRRFIFTVDTHIRTHTHHMLWRPKNACPWQHWRSRAV